MSSKCGSKLIKCVFLDVEERSFFLCFVDRLEFLRNIRLDPFLVRVFGALIILEEAVDPVWSCTCISPVLRFERTYGGRYDDWCTRFFIESALEFAQQPFPV